MIFFALFSLLFGVWFVLPYIVKKIQIGSLRRRCREGRIIVLTYDDGPGKKLTIELLKLLDKHNAVATFFLLGHKIDSLKSEIAQLVSGGHEIGSHSYRHLHAWKSGPASIFCDIENGLRAVRAASPCRLFRAPYGKVTLGTLLQVSVMGCRQSWWTIDSTDTWERPKSISEILDVVRKQGGGVVLMHDLDRPESPVQEKLVLDLTRELLNLAVNERFRICKLGEVIDK